MASVFEDGDYIFGKGALWRVRLVPMKWGASYLHAARLCEVHEIPDGPASHCYPVGHDFWTDFRLVASLKAAA